MPLSERERCWADVPGRAVVVSDERPYLTACNEPGVSKLGLCEVHAEEIVSCGN